MKESKPQPSTKGKPTIMKSRNFEVTDHTAEANTKGKSIDMATGQVHESPPTDPTPSTPLIPPTVGRMVWFQERSKPYSLAAIIVFVHGPELVNLAVFNEDGVVVGIKSVSLWHGGDLPKPPGNYAEWMPYQIGQAKKHADKTEIPPEPRHEI